MNTECYKYRAVSITFLKIKIHGKSRLLLEEKWHHLRQQLQVIFVNITLITLNYKL